MARRPGRAIGYVAWITVACAMGLACNAISGASDLGIGSEAVPASQGRHDRVPTTTTAGTTTVDAEVQDEGAPPDDSDLPDRTEPPDAPSEVDAGGVVSCPSKCNGGCGPRGDTCIVVITSAGGGVSCPPDFDCEVHCKGQQVCLGNTINCASGHACKVACEGDHACDVNTINQNGASAFCVDCLGGGTVKSCDTVTCSGTCSLHCETATSCGTGGDTPCPSCTRVPACP